MPAWVRDVQAGQAPGAGIAAEGGGFSARSLMNEDALPQWLREAGAGGGGLQAPQAPQGYPPAYGAAAAPPAYGQPAGGSGGAQSPYDESNLPGWLFQPGANGASPQQFDAFPTARQPSPNVGMPQPPAPRPNAFPGIEPAGAYRPAPSGGLSGNSLLDDNALPGWMRGDPSPAQGDPAAAYRDAGGMRGHSLIDDAALPAWLRNQPGPSAAQPFPNVQPPQPQPPTAPSIANWIGGSAANDAMPAWLDQAYNEARVPPLQSPPQAPAGGAWPANGAPPNGAPPLPGSLNASSLMDESALPEWLRTQGQGQGQGQAQQQVPAPPNMGRPPMGAPHGGTLADMHTARMPQPRQGPDQGNGWQASRNPTRDAFGNEPEPQRFSASDLIDPDALPGFMQGGNGGSAAGGAAAFGALPGNNAARSRAPGQWPDRDGQQGPMRSQPSRRGVPIPEEELPPWLAEPDPSPIPMQRGAPSSRRGTDAYDSRRMPVPRDWDDDQYDASQWAGGVEDQDAGLPGDYEDDPPPRGRRDGGRGQRPARNGDRASDGERDWERGGPTGGRRRDRRGFFGR